MELQNDQCFWCESVITRPSNTLPWIDEDNMARCLFHPANWSQKTMTSTEENANHQTSEQVSTIVVGDYFRVKALREKRPLRAVDDNVVLVSNKAQRTSRLAAEGILPRTGTMRRRVHDLVLSSLSTGVTDDELEESLGGKHQSISACRRSLVIDGYLVDSGRTRKNRVGNECIVWTHTSKEYSETLFND